MSISPLLTAQALAQHIGVTVGCLAKWRMSGVGPRYIRVQRRIMYDPADVQSWLDARRALSTSQPVSSEASSVG